MSKLGTINISAIKLGSTGISKAYLGSSVVYSAEEDYSKLPLFVESLSGNGFNLVMHSNVYKRGSSEYRTSSERTIEYSEDLVTWTSKTLPYTLATYQQYNTGVGYTVAIPITGKRVYIRSTTPLNVCTSAGANGWHIHTNTPFKVGGNITSLVYGSSFNGQRSVTKNGNNAFAYGLFSGANNLSSAKDIVLPTENSWYGSYTSGGSTIYVGAYQMMFSGCTSLTTPPELPQTNGLTTKHYDNMFNNCTSLTTAPALPATTLTDSCYNCMFRNCTSLTTAPALPATTLLASCYNYMFNGCTSLTTAPELPATTLADGCYACMFSSCTSLTAAPELPATTLKKTCYYEMFIECTNLNYIKIHFTSWPNFSTTSNSTYQATMNWLDNTKGTGTFVCPSSLSQTRGTNYIPNSWTVQTY